MDLREHIIYVLEHYNQMKAKAEVLKFELRNINRMKESEMIEALTFLSTLKGNEKVVIGSLSDKTTEIALAYKDKLEQLRKHARMAISVQLSDISIAIERLELCISKLPANEASIITEYYFDRYSWRELQELKGIAAKTLIRHRDEGIKKLIEMYKPLMEAGLLTDYNT